MAASQLCGRCIDCFSIRCLMKVVNCGTVHARSHDIWEARQFVNSHQFAYPVTCTAASKISNAGNFISLEQLCLRDPCAHPYMLLVLTSCDMFCVAPARRVPVITREHLPQGTRRVEKTNLPSVKHPVQTSYTVSPLAYLLSCESSSWSRTSSKTYIRES